MGSSVNPLPAGSDKVAYWVIAAVVGALAGGVTYNWLRRVDPL